MNVGFTGTREGMTIGQIARFNTLLDQLKPVAFHFGDCLGADYQAFALVRANLPDCKTIAHPPTDDKLRAWCEADVICEPQLYAERNEAIVDACDLLVATPLETSEVLRSGTWMTVRMARRRGRTVHLILRDVS